ncbi:DsbA family protein [Rhodobacteraceae bacterium B1Z28]|uniref:DsbA family protein n=1 Tax=Ruegeria haliotis TaxID=2747601 RepID=A0ABX2PMP6_9RHOB|nr:DsbA family protein [Ruegeria haliotis]
MKPHIAAILTSRGLLTARRQAQELKRRVRREPHIVRYFHDVSDPYCYLTSQVLVEFQRRYKVELRPYLISGPPSDALPDPKAYHDNAIRDVMQLAKRFDMPSPKISKPNVEAISQAERILAAGISCPDFATIARQVSSDLWSGSDLPSMPEVDPSNVMNAGDRALAAAGHYLGGTFQYAGEWYWGVDRLHYLESRLQQAGLGERVSPIVPVPRLQAENAFEEGRQVEFFFSFRSPYSYLAFDRIRDLTCRHNAKLILRPVLPMLMRGLPVPSLKSSYILKDCAREARRMEIPFGRICDPLGKGVERGYALLDFAEGQGLLPEFCAAFMSGVWADGLNAATDQGLSKIVRRAGLIWKDAQADLNATGWLSRITANQDHLQEIGLWGVPSFRVGGRSIWGQDRLWAVEDLLTGTR